MIQGGFQASYYAVIIIIIASLVPPITHSHIFLFLRRRKKKKKGVVHPVPFGMYNKAAPRNPSFFFFGSIALVTLTYFTLEWRSWKNI
ncbi:Uncharacterized protein TCM_035504 [Theobroma cacao]|uniref:Uncharacterized protein n=1 Tax=Theobroma cacao TaxID=3641 RepID=A0A061FII0_THECC|nr:Uncharacterized protein TCM_035504 [Theobroma cacao]